MNVPCLILYLPPGLQLAKKEGQQVDNQLIELQKAKGKNRKCKLILTSMQQYMTFIILNLHSMVFFCRTSFSSALFPLILWSCWDLFTVPMKFFRNIPEMSSLILTPPPHPPGNQLANKEEQQADNQLSDYQKAKGKKIRSANCSDRW